MTKLFITLIVTILLATACAEPGPGSEPEPQSTCIATTIEATPQLAGVCAGVNPILVQCDMLITQRSDLNLIVGTVPICTRPAGDAARELPYVACCYVDAAPSDAGENYAPTQLRN